MERYKGIRELYNCQLEARSFPEEPANVKRLFIDEKGKRGQRHLNHWSLGGDKMGEKTHLQLCVFRAKAFVVKIDIAA